jgi:small subunit ribosomal protein S4
MSDYGRQLLEKQRLRYQYNIAEKQLRNTFEKALGKHGNTGEILMLIKPILLCI